MNSLEGSLFILMTFFWSKIKSVLCSCLCRYYSLMFQSLKYCDVHIIYLCYHSHHRFSHHPNTGVCLIYRIIYSYKITLKISSSRLSFLEVGTHNTSIPSDLYTLKFVMWNSFSCFFKIVQQSRSVTTRIVYFAIGLWV